MHELKRWCGRLVVFLAAGGLGCVEAADEQPKLTIATWNVEWFYDDHRQDNESDLARSQSAPSAAAWQWKLTEVARVIAALRPDIIALQEIEGRRVLDALTEQLREQHNERYRFGFLQGGDVHTEQDVAVLYRGDLVAISREEQTREMFESNQYFNVQKHLFARFRFRRNGADERLTLLTAHLRARSEQHVIRRRQCRLLHTWLREEIVAGENVVVLGDFNTEIPPGEASAANDIGVLMGLGTEDTNDDLLDLHERIELDDQATHISGRSFDRMLVSPALVQDAKERKDWVLSSVRCRRDLVVRGDGPDRNHANNYWGIPEDERDVSDHYPIVAEFTLR